MIEVGKTNFSAMYLHEDLSLMELHWINQESEEMKEKDYKEALLTCLGLIQLHKPSSFLLNSENLSFPIRPELQE